MTEQEDLAVIKLFGMRLIDVEPREDGLQLVAMFDWRIGGIFITGCRLFKNENNKFHARFPYVRNSKGSVHSVSIHDKDLYQKLLDGCLATYRSLSGDENG